MIGIGAEGWLKGVTPSLINERLYIIPESGAFDKGLLDFFLGSTARRETGSANRQPGTVAFGLLEGCELE